MTINGYCGGWKEPGHAWNGATILVTPLWNDDREPVLMCPSCVRDLAVSLATGVTMGRWQLRRDGDVIAILSPSNAWDYLHKESQQ